MYWGTIAQRLIMDSTNLGTFRRVLMVLMVIFTIPFSQGYTYEQDVFAINCLYVSLGSPPLPGWIPNGGDPCLEGWQGIRCVNSNITAIIVNAANLGGQLGDKLSNFSSMITIDLSNNLIGGSIPENLPLTMKEFFLSANQFTGSIPSSLSGLTLLSAMSLNNNLLTGELPDAFQSLTSLANLDLSSNNLSGQLPPSMASLSALITLRIQNNQLSGALNVLQDLPLQDLNIENNLFSGPVPEKLLAIPNFKKDGNPFNTSIAPLSPPPPSPLPEAPTSPVTPANPANGSSVQDGTHPEQNKKLSTEKIVGIGFAAVISVIIVILVVILIANYCMSKHRKRKSNHEKVPRRQEMGAYGRPKEEPKSSDHRRQEMGAYGRPKVELKTSDHLIIPNNEVPNDETNKVPKVAAEKPKEEHAIDSMGVVLLQPPVKKVIVNPIVPIERTARTPSPEKDINPPTSVVSFSVASLQEYTNSFSEGNLVRDDRLGKVYQAELPDGKLLLVMKLDNANSTLPEDGFLELVLAISELRHPNIVELVGYCAEYGQRLLVYNHFSKRTLHDVLHSGDDLKRKLSWNARIQVALGAAKALEYLHEGCQPPVVHQNFESANILLDDELTVRVCDCGLASLLSSNSVYQLSGRIRALFSYEAPEVSDSGTYTDRSDVYSFGVVMLELLTGRKPYDSLRPRAEQSLVRWASSQLHDIDTLSKMVDPSVEGKYPIKSLSRFADIISRCIQNGPEFRPQMSEVVQDLTRMVEEVRGRSNGNSPPV